MNISVIGLGKLGSVMAAVLADAGHEVSGVDVNPAVVEAIQDRRAPVHEPGLAELIQKNASRLSASTDIAAAVLRTDVTFVVLPTPSEVDGTFSLSFVLRACETIATVLGKKSGYHLVVLSSTVMPGHTEDCIRPLMERVSGKKCGADFGLCYNPEFIALGTVIRDIRNPDMILIGECDAGAGDMLEQIYRQGLCDNHPPIARMNFMNAELTKISVNTFVTMKISYANMLAELCERLAGADARVVSDALGFDTRIGGKYLQGALGFGGPCFPRDNAAFARLAATNGVEATLAVATDRINRRQAARLGDLILRTPDNGPVAILGLAYKPDTDVIEESQGVQLAQYLTEAGRRVIVYDPAAMVNARTVLGHSVAFAASMVACVAETVVIAITTPWSEFKSLRPEHLRSSGSKPLIFDWWRILSAAEFEQVAGYVVCGQ